MSEAGGPPAKVTKYEMESQFLEGEVTEEGQEEWLSEGVLTDEDYNPASQASQDSVEQTAEDESIEYATPEPEYEIAEKDGQDQKNQEESRESPEVSILQNFTTMTSDNSQQHSQTFTKTEGDISQTYTQIQLEVSQGQIIVTHAPPGFSQAQIVVTEGQVINPGQLGGQIITQDGQIITQSGQIITQDGQIIQGQIITQDGQIITQEQLLQGQIVTEEQLGMLQGQIVTQMSQEHESSQESKTQESTAHGNIEQTLTNFENEREDSVTPDLPDDLDAYLIRKSVARSVAAAAPPPPPPADDDGNDTDDLLRMLGDDNKGKKKQRTRKAQRNQQQKHASSDDDDYVYSGKNTAVKNIQAAKKALSRKPATKAVPEQVSDGSDNEPLVLKQMPSSIKVTRVSHDRKDTTKNISTNQQNTKQPSSLKSYVNKRVVNAQKPQQRFINSPRPANNTPQRSANVQIQSQRVFKPSQQVINTSQQVINTPQQPQRAANTPKQPQYIINAGKQPQLVVNAQQQVQQLINTEKQPQRLINTRKQPQRFVNTEKQPQRLINTEKQPESVVNLQQLPQSAINTEKPPEPVVKLQKLPQRVINASTQPQREIFTEKQPQRIINTEKQPEPVTITQQLPQRVMNTPKQPQRVLNNVQQSQQHIKAQLPIKIQEQRDTQKVNPKQKITDMTKILNKSQTSYGQKSSITTVNKPQQAINNSGVNNSPKTGQTSLLKSQVQNKVAQVEKKDEKKEIKQNTEKKEREKKTHTEILREILLKPERMDEEMPSDEDSGSDHEDSIYDELPSSDSENLDEWFTLDIRAERAGEYLPLLGDRAYELLLEEKHRTETRLNTLKSSLSSLTESGRKQAEDIRKVTVKAAELDALLKAT